MRTIVFLCAVSAIAAVSAEPQSEKAETGTKAISVSFVESGYWKLAAIDRVTDGAGRRFTAGKPISLFSVELSPVGAFSEKTTVEARDAGVREVERIPDGLRLTYSGFRERLENVVCTVRTGAAGELRWRIAVTPKEGFAATEVNYPQLLLADRLGDAQTDTLLVHGGRDWGLVRNPAETWDPKQWQGVGLVQPGNLYAQFCGYYDAKGGLYSAAEDGRAYAKRLAFYRTGAGLLFSWNWRDWIVSTRELPYDVVTASFAGPDGEPTEWTDAADLYRAWARTQRWCRTPFRDRSDLPGWLKSGVPIVRFYRSWLDEPEKIRKWLENHWKKSYPDTALAGAVWGWEKIDTWTTPDYFPLYPSDETFAKIVAAFRDNGVRFFPWPSGYNWTLSRYKLPDGSFKYESRAAFEKFRHLAVRDRSGEVLVKHPSWYSGGEMPVICRGDVRSREWWTTAIADELFKRGAEMIQFDQVNGGRHEPCWCRDHGHLLGAGLWWAESMLDQLDRVAAAARRHGIVPVLGFEDPNEFYLDRVGVQDYRDVEISATNRSVASVWNYLYHEFVPTFQSNPRRGDRWMQAHCAADGQMPFLVPESSEIGGCEAVVNGTFAEFNGTSGIPLGWRFGHDKDVGGTVTVEPGAAPGGLNAVRLTAKAGERAYLNVDSRTADDGAYVPGRTYRFSFLVKNNAGKGGFGADWSFTENWRGLGGVQIKLPEAGTGWTRLSREFVMPANAVIFHYAFVVPGEGDAEVADMKVESVGADGSVEKVTLKGNAAYTAFMSRWVSLYHGEARDFLAYGRRIRPPRVACGRMTHRFSTERAKFDGEVETVCSAAYETLDGSRRALALANATAEPQSVSWTWKGERTELTLRPDEIRLVPLK